MLLCTNFPDPLILMDRAGILDAGSENTYNSCDAATKEKSIPPTRRDTSIKLITFITPAYNVT